MYFSCNMWMNWTLEFVILIITFWISLYFYFTRNFNHWKKLNVPYLKPIPFFGNALEVLTQKKSLGGLYKELHEKNNKPFLGFFVLDKPYLLIRDLDMIKAILVKDFGIFNNRNITVNEKDDAMGSHMLFLLRTPEWRDVRQKFTPIFTTGNIKMMYELMRECAENMVKYLEKEVAKNSDVDISELTGKFATDTVTSTAFGINANCFKDENAEFRQVSRRIFNCKILERSISITCYIIAPTLVKLFRLKLIDTFSSIFLRDAFLKTMKEREESKSVRNDLIDVLIDIKNKEKIEPDLSNKSEANKLVAQAAQFFVAGFETTSSAISFTLLELALNPKIQEKLREEILRTKQKFGKFSYDALREMQYLDICIKETLRKYPPAPLLERMSNADYKLPGTDLVLKKGTGVCISTWGLHFDPQYFPNPDQYDPTRFSEENIKSIPQCAYLPFGEGPRKCIGSRFANLNAKSGIVHILYEYKVELSGKLKLPIKFTNRGVFLTPEGTLYLKFKKL